MIENPFSKELGVSVMPREVVLTMDGEMAHHESTTMDIQVLSKEADAKRSLTVVSYSPSIAVPKVATVTTNDQGRASVDIETKLPGQAVVVVSLDNTSLLPAQKAAFCA